MLYVENNVIYLTKGDDGKLPVNVTLGDESYQMSEYDTLTITVRELPSAESPVLLQIETVPGSNRIIFNSADTKDISPGRYSADIQLTDGGGRKYTIWPRLEGNKRYNGRNYENFVIMPEVTV